MELSSNDLLIDLAKIGLALLLCRLLSSVEFQRPNHIKSEGKDAFPSDRGSDQSIVTDHRCNGKIFRAAAYVIAVNINSL